MNGGVHGQHCARRSRWWVGKLGAQGLGRGVLRSSSRVSGSRRELSGGSSQRASAVADCECAGPFRDRCLQPRPYHCPVCNLYQMASREHVAVYFRAIVPDSYQPVTVGPFGTGAFLRAASGGLELVTAQWGMIAPGSKTRRPTSRAILTNNARAETVASRPTYRGAWAAGQRCLIPAAWYQEPTWETGKHIPWRMKRADGAPWALAGIWSEWTDPATGEIVPNYTMILGGSHVT